MNAVRTSRRFSQPPDSPAPRRVTALAAVVALAVSVPVAAQAPDYESIWGEGVSFAAFLQAAEQQADAWQSNYRQAAPDEEALTRARAIDGTGLRLLVVAEDWCSDSVDAVPHIARLAETIPGLELRVVNSSAGAAVMETHRTPDDRGATPTVVVLGPKGEPLGTWVERPAELQDWFLAHRDELRRRELLARKHQWYVEDGGRSTVNELLDLIERARDERP